MCITGETIYLSANEGVNISNNGCNHYTCYEKEF